MSIFKHWGIKSWIFFAVLWFFAISAIKMVYQLSSDMAILACVALAAFIAAIIVHALNSSAEKKRRMTQSVADSRLAIDRSPALDAWQQLGSDPEERERSINLMFDANIGAVEFDTMWDFDYLHKDSAGLTETAYSSMSFRIARNIAALDNREREFLRAAYLLYNASLIDLQTWRDLTFCFVYGEGKASIMSCEYREPIALPFNDGPGAIKYYADNEQSTVDSTVSKLLHILEGYAAKPDVPPIVHSLMSRIGDGRERGWSQPG